MALFLLPAIPIAGGVTIFAYYKLIDLSCNVFSVMQEAGNKKCNVSDLDNDDLLKVGCISALSVISLQFSLPKSMGTKKDVVETTQKSTKQSSSTNNNNTIIKSSFKAQKSNTIKSWKDFYKVVRPYSNRILLIAFLSATVSGLSASILLQRENYNHNSNSNTNKKNDE